MCSPTKGGGARCTTCGTTGGRRGPRGRGVEELAQVPLDQPPHGFGDGGHQRVVSGAHRHDLGPQRGGAPEERGWLEGGVVVLVWAAAGRHLPVRHVPVRVSPPRKKVK